MIVNFYVTYCQNIYEISLLIYKFNYAWVLIVSYSVN